MSISSISAGHAVPVQSKPYVAPNILNPTQGGGTKASGTEGSASEEATESSATEASEHGKSSFNKFV